LTTNPRLRAGAVPAIFFVLVLLLAACQPDAPEPTPPSPSPTTSSPPATASSPPATSSPSVTGEPPPEDSVHFTAQGDLGLGSGARKVLDVIAGLDPQLSIALGDLGYTAGKEQEFCDLVTGKLGEDFPFQLITGNHESDGEDGAIENYVQCLPNRLPGLQGDYGRQWYVDVPEQNPLVRFVLVSPGIDFRDGEPLDYSRGSERWQWTVDAIEGADSEDIPWTVVGMHALCFSVGEKECQIGEEFSNMLVDKKVDLVLTGHDHIYQRSHQLGIGIACPGMAADAFRAGCLTDEDSSMVEGAGTVFVTVGTGGVSLYEVSDNDPEAGYFAAWSGKNRNPALGTLDVRATEDRLDARFVPAEGSSFTDSFRIERR
jgi:Calcineurin-like phosphoesterase